MTYILRALDTSNLTLLDLSAAFDTVDHASLLRRLSMSYGLDGAILSWFRSYLGGRTQFVRCGFISSTLSCGVPQGSVFGPIFFLLYTADLLGLIELHDLIPHLYANETQICGYSPPSNVLQLQERVSGCVDDVAKWMQSNRLQLNTAKTEMLWCASIRRQHQIPQPGLCVGVNVIVLSASVWDLEIYLDYDVSMRIHVSKVVSSCFAVLWRLRRIRSSVLRPVFVSLVVSLVLSRLDYGNATLAGITDRLMDRLRPRFIVCITLLGIQLTHGLLKKTFNNNNNNCGPCSTRLRRTSTLPVEPSTWHRSSVICTGFDIPIGSTTSWRCWSTDASKDWRRATSPTNSRVCRRLSRDRIFGRLQRPILSCLAFSGRHSAVVHSLWQRLKHGTAYRHMSHHLHRWRHSNATSRLGCSWDRMFNPDIG